MTRVLVMLFVALGLVLTSCGKGTVGLPCKATSDCEFGQTCYTNAPGGYCTKGCSAEGTAKDCPGGSVCAQSLGLLLCSTLCQAQTDCRTDYECNGVTGSSAKACTVKPR